MDGLDWVFPGPLRLASSEEFSASGRPKYPPHAAEELPTSRVASVGGRCAFGAGMAKEEPRAAWARQKCILRSPVTRQSSLAGIPIVRPSKSRCWRGHRGVTPEKRGLPPPSRREQLACLRRVPNQPRNEDTSRHSPTSPDVFEESLSSFCIRFGLSGTSEEGFLRNLRAAVGRLDSGLGACPRDTA